jgi:hypothetical protein
MQQRLSNLAWIALFLCLVFGFGTMVYWSSRHHPPKQIAAQQRQDRSENGDWLTKDAAGFFTFLLVIVGVGQASLFVWQLRIMKSNIDDARMMAQSAQASAETAKEQVAITKMRVIDLERAYLSVGPSDIETQFSPVAPLEIVVKLHVQNFGRTGAVITKIYGEFSRQPPTGNIPVYKHGDSHKTDISVPAGQGDVLSPFEFKVKFVNQIFFWGYVEYNDIFKIKRITRFCAEIVPSTLKGAAGKYGLAGDDGWRQCD